MMVLAGNDGEAEFKVSIGKARLLTGLALIVYPVGAAMLGFGPDQTAYVIVGWTLVFIAMLSTLFLMGMSLHRIVSGQESMLDEFELKLRHRAISTAYGMIALLGALAIFGLQMLTDSTTVHQSDALSGDYFTGFLWGLMLYATLLPTAVLAWNMDPADLNGDEDVDHG